MKFSFLTLLIAALLITLALRADNVPTSAPAPVSTYIDNVYKFSMNGPNFGPASGAVSPVFFKGPTEHGFSPNVNVLIQPGKMTRDEYLKLTMDQMKQFDGTLNSRKDAKVCGRDAAIFDYQATMQGHPLRFLALAVFEDDRVDLVTCTAAPDDFPHHKDAFENCIASFNLLP